MSSFSELSRWAGLLTSATKKALLLRKNFKILLPYAENYIVEYDREVAKNILPWKEEEVDETDGE